MNIFTQKPDLDLNHRERPERPVVHIVIRVCVCLFIVALGFTGMKFLGGMKKAPAEAKVEERVLQVEAVRVERKDYPVSIRGYGEVHPLTVVPVAPEVSGKIIDIYPRLEVGDVIQKGAVLFRIDPREYEIVSRRGGERLKILRQNLKLAERELKRVRPYMNGVGWAPVPVWRGRRRPGFQRRIWKIRLRRRWKWRI